MIDTKILDEVLPAPGLDELKEDAVTELKDEGFVVTNFHPGGVFYTLLVIVLKIRMELTGLLRNILSNMFVTHATGVWLDLIAANFSKKRKKKTKTKGFVTVSRTTDLEEAIHIPKGNIFKTQKDINGEELRFFVVENAVLQQGAVSVDVVVEAEKEGTLYNVPPGQITRSFTYLGEVQFNNGSDWIAREGSDTEDDESLRARILRAWSALAMRAIEDAFVNAAEGIPGVLFAQADCYHPRGQGTIDVIVTGTSGEASEQLLAQVEAAVLEIAGPYDNILVKSSVTSAEDISLVVTTAAADARTDEEIKNIVAVLLTDLLAVRKGRKLNELTRSDINFAVRSGYQEARNVEVLQPASDVKLSKDQVVVLGSTVVTVVRE